MATIISKDELRNEILDITLIDVRNSNEYKHSHIQGAENIPMDELQVEAQKRYNPEKKLVIYGEDDKMGQKAANKLEEEGFKHITLYKDGFQDWIDSHYPTKKVDLGNKLRE
ncbi:MAG: hypothetical protein A2104_10425 [Candidatus Melainabacteria bacterium GWF2_32_7]|nr:MAG: hypothetical protein A2104_10425 [Candidatus Melainabacteria bacterium GWF2_32_7]